MARNSSALRDTSATLRISGAAKLFVDATIAIGIIVMLASEFYWRSDDPVEYAAFLTLALVGSICKVRLPGMTGTYSLAFCFVLIAMLNYSLAETTLLGVLCAVVQCLYSPKRRPSLRSVLFSASGVAISVVVAELIYHAGASMVPASGETGAIILAATAYWFVNTGLVSAALAMAEEGTLTAIWQRWCLGTLPYYVVGAGISIPASRGVQTGHWLAMLFIVPALALLYSCWRLSIEGGKSIGQL